MLAVAWCGISRPPPAEQVQQALPAMRLTRPCHCGRHGELPDETWIILGESVLHFGEQPLLIFGQTHCAHFVPERRTTMGPAVHDAPVPGEGARAKLGVRELGRDRTGPR